MNLSEHKWYHRKWIVVFSLVLFYPLGLLLLACSPWRNRGGKFAVALCFLVLFVVQCYVVFGLGPSGVKRQIKRSIVWWHDYQLERQRTGQVDQIDKLNADRQISLNLGQGDYPEYRGPNRDGVITPAAHHLPWPPDGPRLLWDKLVGTGLGSVSVVDDRIYTLEQRGGDEAVTCFDLSTGNEVWAYRYRALFEEGMGGPGPRSTPTFAEGKLFALGATGILNCLNPISGDLIWTRDILKDARAKNLHWGMAGSPLVNGGRVYVSPGGPQASVIAYSTESGEVLWKGGSHAAGYASPAVGTINGQQQLIVFDGDGLSAYDPSSGNELWHYPWETDFGVNAAQPIILQNNQIFLSSGYGKGCALLQIKNQNGGFSVEPVWTNKNLKMKFNSAVRLDNFIFGPDNKIFTCLDLATGERKWRKGRYGECHVLLVAPYLLIQCEDGDLALVEASGDEWTEVSRVPALDRRTVQPPVIAQGKLIIRNDRRMRCYDLQ